LQVPAEDVTRLQDYLRTYASAHHQAI
jgi:hypothetical protein